MKNNKALLLSIISALSLTISGCGNKNITGSESTSTMSSSESSESTSSKDSSSSTDTTSYTFSQEEDFTGLIPQEVLDADCDIDIMIYIEGQEGAISDIGNYYCGDKNSEEYKAMVAKDPTTARKYDQYSISSSEMNSFFGAAAAFKKLAPNVRINLKYCSIADYPTRVEAYQKTNKHLPEILWGTETVSAMLEKGWCTDLSKYEGTEYYDQYNEYFLSRFNFGGFQAAFPMSCYPWAMFVNLDILGDAQYGIVNEVFDENGYCTQEYKDWVDNFTMESLVEAAKKTHDATHAGIDRVSEYYTTYSVRSIADNFLETGKVDLTSPEARQKIEYMLTMENELSKYTAYEYTDGLYSLTSGGYVSNTPKNGYDVRNWRANQDFCIDHDYTFFSEAPWAISNISQYVTTDESASVRNGKFDMIPYPKVSKDDEDISGVGVGALVVGNQCPIENGKENCSTNGKLKSDVAAYFLMFYGLDPRSLKERSEIKYVVNDEVFVGNLQLPLIKRDSKFSWQTDPDSDIEDPAEGFEDNWSYQLYNYFKLNKLYLTTDEEPDVYNFTNITYGVVKLLDSIYMLDGIGDDYVHAIEFKGDPRQIDMDGETYDIFEKWTKRFVYYGQPTEDGLSYSGRLGSSDYVSVVLSNLSDIEDYINTNSNRIWGYLAEMIDSYYYDESGESLYPNAKDRSYRNNFEGSRYLD